MLFNGVLAGSEIALVTVRSTRLQELVESGKRGAKAARQLRQNPERFLATVQVGITVVGATAGAFGGAAFAEDLAVVLRPLPGVGPYARQVALALVVGLLSYLSLVFGELVPKSLAMRSAEPYALLVSRPLLGLSSLARPMVWLLTASSNVILRPFRDRTTFTETRLSRDELSQVLEEATRVGTVHPKAGAIAARALALSDLAAEEVMVPRNKVVALAKGSSAEELRAAILEHTHTRMPVYEGEIDHVVGYVSIKDLLPMAWNRRPVVLEEVLRPAFFVPLAKRAVDLLHEMRERRTPFAIVVDELGGMAGIVTLEDLVEELVGEIFSEHERDIPSLFERRPDQSVVVSAAVAVRDVNRELALALPEGEWTTLGGLCLYLANRIPVRGETFTTPDGSRLEVLEASARRIHKVRIVPAPPPQASADGNGAG